ncbi:unnamed protein product, partial [Polarella glacialis]
ALANKGFSQDRAIMFAKLAGAAYCSPESLEAWSCGEKCIPQVSKPVKVCAGETTQAFVTTWEHHGLVSFEGTKTYMSMVQDLRTYKSATNWPLCGDSCSVHDGFLTEWQSLKSCVEDSLTAIGSPKGSEIRVTGHSLGGAVSSLAMVELHYDGWHIKEAMSFGMPRAGDTGFSQVFTRLFSGRYFRVTHHMDPIPHVPPEEFDFLHFGREVFYDGDVSLGHKECDDAEDELCAGQYWNVVSDLAYVSDHLDYMGQATGSTGCVGLSRALNRSSTHEPSTAPLPLVT